MGTDPQEDRRMLFLYPDVAPFADNRPDCRDLLQRNVIHHEPFGAAPVITVMVALR
jgi:hypothetical protein